MSHRKKTVQVRPSNLPVTLSTEEINRLKLIPHDRREGQCDSCWDTTSITTRIIITKFGAIAYPLCDRCVETSATVN